MLSHSSRLAGAPQKSASEVVALLQRLCLTHRLPLRDFQTSFSSSRVGHAGRPQTKTRFHQHGCSNTTAGNPRASHKLRTTVMQCSFGSVGSACAKRYLMTYSSCAKRYLKRSRRSSSFASTFGGPMEAPGSTRDGRLKKLESNGYGRGQSQRPSAFLNVLNVHSASPGGRFW